MVLWAYWYHLGWVCKTPLLALQCIYCYSIKYLKIIRRPVNSVNTEWLFNHTDTHTAQIPQVITQIMNQYDTVSDIIMSIDYIYSNKQWALKDTRVFPPIRCLLRLCPKKLWFHHIFLFLHLQLNKKKVLPFQEVKCLKKWL